MRNLLPILLTGLVVFAPWLAVEALGGRAATRALTGMDLHALPLALLQLLTWTWMVFTAGPWLAGAIAWIAAGTSRDPG